MTFRETDPYKISVDSVWKYINIYKSDPVVDSGNYDYRVILASRDSIRFGRIHSNGEAFGDHSYRPKEFMNSAVPIGDGSVKDKTQLASLVSQIKNCNGSYSEIYDMLVELEI